MKPIVTGCIALFLAGCASTAPDRTADTPAPRTEAGVASTPALPGARPDMPTRTPSAPPAVLGDGAPRPVPPAAGAPVSGAPTGTLYVCVTDSGGQRRQVAIEFAPNVQSLCQRHPEMGPCQYERAACRHAGGRVFDATGREITLATEAEYDRKVMRFRLRSN